jgi:23S rRNA pseudouridine1911/1915/1917 synthase
MKKRIFRRAEKDPLELAELVAARGDLTQEDALALIAHGAVYVDGQRLRNPSWMVKVGQKIVVHLGMIEATPPLAIVHRDHDVAVVDKPAGLPAQSEPSQAAFSLTEAATRQLGPEARVMHRLDKEASGLVVVALRKTAYAPLQHAFTTHAVERRYLAIVGNEANGDGVVRARIARHPKDARLRTAVDEHDTAGEAACTRYRALAHGTLESAPVTAVELQLETGRTHQIRVHMMWEGHPLVGDTAYGGMAFERLCLHAYAIELPHPRTGKALRVSSPVPEAFTRLVPRLTSPFA